MICCGRDAAWIDEKHENKLFVVAFEEISYPRTSLKNRTFSLEVGAISSTFQIKFSMFAHSTCWQQFGMHSLSDVTNMYAK